MTPLHKKSPRFHFSGSVPISPGATTYAGFKTPSAPWRVRGAQPSITRIFKKRITANVRRERKEAPKMKVDDDSSALDLDSTSIEETSRRLATPVPSSRSKTPDRFIDLEHPRFQASRKRKDRVTPLVRFASVVSTGRNSSSPEPICQDRPSRPSRDAELSIPVNTSPDSTSSVWTPWGTKNGDPVFVRQSHSSSTKDKDCVTYWWKCRSRTLLSTPPDLSQKSDLAIGDLLCNYVEGISIPQMWIWTTVGAHPPCWKPIAEGDLREDGRRLSITPVNKKPSWVNPEWCLKQMVRKQKSTRQV
ncbi:hypothetical protein C8Q78DRAFT_990953 [Trametes maxima]|nr:hypothetical protein C8Q78DRAFT_990953 [Trametes maxima]